jgi:hypothetical protein
MVGAGSLTTIQGVYGIVKVVTTVFYVGFLVEYVPLSSLLAMIPLFTDTEQPYRKTSPITDRCFNTSHCYALPGPLHPLRCSSSNQWRR